MGVHRHIVIWGIVIGVALSDRTKSNLLDRRKRMESARSGLFRELKV
jgi:hypothetical protein